MDKLKPRSFRISDRDVALLDALVKHFTEKHGIKTYRPDVLRKAINELADGHLTEKQRNIALEHLRK